MKGPVLKRDLGTKAFGALLSGDEVWPKVLNQCGSPEGGVLRGKEIRPSDTNLSHLPATCTAWLSVYLPEAGFSFLGNEVFLLKRWTSCRCPGIPRNGGKVERTVARKKSQCLWLPGRPSTLCSRHQSHPGCPVFPLQKRKGPSCLSSN